MTATKQNSPAASVAALYVLLLEGAMIAYDFISLDVSNTSL
jgi:hypothetical protein